MKIWKSSFSPKWGDVVTWIWPSVEAPWLLSPSGLCSLVCRRPHHFLGTSRHEFITFALNKHLHECMEIVLHISSVLSHTWWASHPWHGCDCNLASFHLVLFISFSGITTLLAVGARNLGAILDYFFSPSPTPGTSDGISFHFSPKHILNWSTSHRLHY